MGDPVPLMEPKTWAALERLIKVARGDTHQSRYASNFLLAWWNARDLGGFNLTDAWGVDTQISEDMIEVFSFVVRHNNYPDYFGLGSEFEALVQMWRSQVVEGL